jgi:hypothetical protein
MTTMARSPEERGDVGVGSKAEGGFGQTRAP